MRKLSFSFVDLFSGIGGFRIALSSIGGTCLNFSEINSDAIDSYCKNFNENASKNVGDITQVKELPSHDILTAGVPCQSWSIAGRNLGFDDDRGQLWNDTLYVLQQSKPKAFIFENVKGLADPRNKPALDHILHKIKEIGYFSDFYVINSLDYGVAQNRIRIYIVGFLEERYFLKFSLKKPQGNTVKLADILSKNKKMALENNQQQDLFGHPLSNKSMSLSSNDGLNDYFLFNDLRNGHSTIHSWDILDTNEKQKKICYLLLKNRRKSKYGQLDGNPLALNHFQGLDHSITQADLDGLVKLGILKPESYAFQVKNRLSNELTPEETSILEEVPEDFFVIDDLKSKKNLKSKKINIHKNIQNLIDKKIVSCIEIRYDFKNTKISTGLFGVNRIFLPTSNIFPTLVASDSYDYITDVSISKDRPLDYKKNFIEQVYKERKYRKITKEEACLIQGFPKNFALPESRSRWMKLIGNSVSVPVVQMLGQCIVDTGVFDENEAI